ncbi:hypothetical protein [Virgibacillus sp. YIM 98842]|nr:hypothetical protein [Virgibacillus sp. YIM 98842]
MNQLYDKAGNSERLNLFILAEFQLFYSRVHIPYAVIKSMEG